MNIQVFVVGMFSTDCYVVHCRKKEAAIIIDPGFDSPSEAEQILNYVDKEELDVRFVVNTHGHKDHVSGNRFLKKKYNAPICIHKYDAAIIDDVNISDSSANIILSEGSTLEFGDEKLKVMHTPGHSPGSICLLGEKLIFTGDTLFAGGIGRTDFPGGSMSDMGLSLQKLTSLPDYLLVYPGHGETAMIGEEKRTNAFLNNKNENLLF